MSRKVGLTVRGRVFALPLNEQIEGIFGLGVLGFGVLGLASFVSHIHEWISTSRKRSF